MEEGLKEEEVILDNKKEIGIKESPVELQQEAFSMSENIGNLAGALAKAQGGMNNGAKDKQGYGYKYMELGAITDIIRPNLAANGLSVVQSHELGNNQNPGVYVHTALLHESGEWLRNSLRIPLTMMKQLSPAQMIGVCMTYGRRYALQSLFMIASEDDTDGK